MITRITNWVKVYNTMPIEKMMLKEIIQSIIYKMKKS